MIDDEACFDCAECILRGPVGPSIEEASSAEAISPPCGNIYKLSSLTTEDVARGWRRRNINPRIIFILKFLGLGSVVRRVDSAVLMVLPHWGFEFKSHKSKNNLDISS